MLTGLPQKCLGNLIPACRKPCRVLPHPLIGEVVLMIDVRSPLNFGPRWIAYDPIESRVGEKIEDRPCRIKKIRLKDVLIPQTRELEGRVLKVGWLDIVEQGHDQTELSDPAGIIVSVDAKDLFD